MNTFIVYYRGIIRMDGVSVILNQFQRMVKKVVLNKIYSMGICSDYKHDQK